MSIAIGTTTVVDAVAAAIRDQLLDGALQPGEVLRDTVLSAQFGVARPTIRAAVQVLVADGLVFRDRGRSARVPMFSSADIADLYMARAAIELAALDLIERANAPIGLVTASVARLKSLASTAQWRDVVEADVDFHQALVTTAGSPRLLRMFSGLANETRLVIALQRDLYESVGDLVVEHERIVGALKRKRYDSCRRLLRQHFDHTVAAMSQVPDRKKDIS
ncbi:MAG: transcriptional regulator protein [Ilumatobacteraceae bacterium]|nr:transcriptional regulator protein [Ilumatobacteraceae bacterium]